MWQIKRKQTSGAHKRRTLTRLYFAIGAEPVRINVCSSSNSAPVAPTATQGGIHFGANGDDCGDDVVAGFWIE